MLRSRRGLSEIMGSMISVLILGSMLATVVLVVEDVNRNIRSSAEKAAMRLIEASDPPKLLTYVANGSLILSLEQEHSSVSKIIIYYSNGSIKFIDPNSVKLQNNIYKIIDNYNCEYVKIIVLTELGNMFSKEQRTCNTDPVLGDAQASGKTLVMGSKYTILGMTYAQAGIVEVLDNVNARIELTYRSLMEGGYCKSLVSIRGLGSSQVTESAGFSIGSWIGPVQLVNGIDAYIAPFAYNDGQICVTGININTTIPTLLVGSASFTGSALIDKVTLYEMIERKAVAMPLIYTQRAETQFRVKYPIDSSTIGVTGGVVSFSTNQLYVSRTIALMVATVKNDYNSIFELDLSGTLNFNRILYINSSTNYEYYNISGPYKLRLIVPEPINYGTGYTRALIKALWLGDAASATKVIVEGVATMEIPLSTSWVEVNRYTSQIGILSSQSLSPMIVADTDYYARNTGAYIQVDVKVTVNVINNIVEVPMVAPLIEVVDSGGSMYLIAGRMGHAPPTASQGQTFYVDQDAAVGGALLLVARMHNSSGTVVLDLGNLIKSTGSQVYLNPGIYIVFEYTRISGVKVGSAMVILVP